MAETKYGKYVKKLVFKDYGPGSYRQGVTMDSKFLGLDAQIEFGTYWNAGQMGKEPYGSHKHDFNQLLYWFGGDTSDMGELGAEIELILGEEKERHMLTTTTAVYVRKGLLHFPANIIRMEKRFIFLQMSCAAEYSETPVTLPGPVGAYAGFRSIYREQVIHPAFIRKGAWSYGEKNQDDSGGALASIRGKDFEAGILCESLKKAPYRFGPDPDKPHVHKLPEVLVFMGADTGDISVLGGEVEVYLGEEMERHTITAPTAVICPGGLYHCPVIVTKVDKPFMLTDCRPFGTDPPPAR